MAGTISILGVGSGLQLQDMLDQLREVDEAPIRRLETTKSHYEEQLTAFDKLNQDLLGIKSTALNLSLQSTFLGRSASLSNEEKISVTVTDGAETGSHNITVGRMASASSWQGAGAATRDTVVNSSGSDETFTYHTGSNDPVSITVADGTTLEELANLINNDPDNPGVTASVIDSGDPSTPFRLILKSDSTGENERISIDSQLSGYALSELQGAGGTSLNAEITVDGITYQRQQNSGINDILGGTTINLLETGNVSLSVSEDHTDLKESIKALVEGVNSIIASLNEQTGYDEDGNPELLNDVGSAKSLKYELLDMLGTRVETGGSVKSLFDMGLELNRDGTLTIDDTKLDNALKNNFSDVKTLFTGDDDKGITGIGDQMNDRLRVMTRPSTGLMATERTAAEQRIDNIDTQIESTTARLDRKYEIMAKQFARLDSFMNSMSSMSDYLTSQFDALSGKDKK
jgi:flagellar hook-associated protein 2